MKQRPTGRQSSSEKIIRDIKRRTRKQYNAEEKIRIVLDGLHELQRQGHAIGVDDFGTGYSSLSYMKRLPLKTIKIDRSFIQNIPHDLNDVAISRAIISLSHDLGYEVVAEGVETAEQLEFLLDKGCNYAQGYFFGKPVPAEEFAGLVDDINHRLHVHAGWPARLRSIK